MTNKFISAKGAVLLFEEEAVYGTAEAAPSRAIGIIQSWSIDEKKGVEAKYSQGSSTLQALCSTDYDVTGSFSAVLQRAEILEYFIGTPTDAGEGPYTHTFDTIDEGVKSITLGIGLYDATSEAMLIRQRIAGVRIKKVEFVFGETATIMNCDWEGITVSQDTTLLAYAGMDETVFCAKTWQFQIGDAKGATAHRDTVTNCTITMNRDVAKATGNGSQTPLFKDVDKFSVKISGSEFFATKGIYEDFQNSSSTVGTGQVDKKIYVYATNGGATTALRKIELTFDNCKKTDGFRISSPSSTSFVKVNFSYDGFLSSIVATDNTANWNA